MTDMNKTEDPKSLEKTKVLYIYGYGGSSHSISVDKLKKRLPADKYDVLCFDYPQEDCAAAIAFLQDKIKEYGIGIVSGSSLGAFIAMCLEGRLRKVIVNPCLYPTTALPRLKPLPGKPLPSPSLIASYGPFESHVFDNPGEESACFMADDDELFGNTYRENMEQHYPVTSIPGGHRISSAAMKIIAEWICHLDH